MSPFLVERSPQSPRPPESVEKGRISETYTESEQLIFELS